jgi:PST family polysaccharide transporter
MSIPCATEVATPSVEHSPRVAQTATPEEHTYGQILKSSALIGGSSVLNIGISILRTKAMAVFLGPAGFGLMGVYGSIVDVAQSIAGMGINRSGVRQIAEAVGSNDPERIARTVTVLRRAAIALGTLGGVLLIVFSGQLSTLTFGTDQHAGAVAALSLAVLFRLVADAQGALIQGMRRIADLARMGVLGALLGTAICIPIVYAFRERGVVASLVGIGAMMLLTSWWYSRKIQVPLPPMPASQVWHEAAPLLKLGFAFMVSAFLMMGAAYAVRTMVLRMVGFDAAGFYQAAWTLGGLYVGFILQAMGADFYPRLTAVANDNAACNRMVNEQARVSLLLAGPGVLATLTFAPLVIALFYSATFTAAVEVLRWFCLGMTLRVITWPMGFIILAKGKSHLIIWTELAWTVVNVGLSWICVRFFDLTGAGIAFFGSYIFHGLMLYPIVRHISGLRWSKANRQTGAVFLSLIAVVFSAFHVLSSYWALGVGVVAATLSGAYSVRVLFDLVSVDEMPRPLLYFLTRFRAALSVFKA